ncbi:DUF3795 domain-containing protein [Desulfatiglans anilini]|uniref:DUF3795 domain-containing protein n=1 Tax=Desulfatiglans anilini TaxID=90728 RepID=UPI000408FDB9|nr:DUF3795 domain-containing protein [Desulfatiglans anilini]
MVEINPEYLAPCGLYCGVCAILYAERDGNRKFKERLVDVYKGKLPDSGNLSADDIRCKGCLSDDPFLFCRECAIKACTREKGYTGCHQCDAFPCRLIDEFPMPVGRKVMLRAIPYWRKHGTEKWVAEEEARYHCPACGHRLFRGAKRCNQCGTPVDLD